MSEGRDKPGKLHNYLARDGKYYNGYMLSPDLAEDILPKEVFDKILKKLYIEIMGGDSDKRRLND